MSLNSINVSNVSFKENAESTSEKVKVTDSVKSDFERTPKTDSFEKNENVNTNAENSKQATIQDTQKEAVTHKRKKHRARNIILGIISIPILLYGGMVLKHKLTKPTFEEVQKAFKEIFGKDLSKSEVNNLLDKYKKLLKNENTEDFAKQMIEQLKKDYGIEKVSTNVNVELLKDGRLKTIREHTRLGQATPLGDIDILPRTNSKLLVRDEQKEIFNTGFHELKHMKQFTDAYRANPDKFVDAIYERNVSKDMIEKAVKEAKKEMEKEMEKEIKKGAETFLKDKDLEGMTLSEIEKMLKEETYKEIDINTERMVIQEIKNEYRKVLDERFGLLGRFKEGSEEYKKGMEYIEAYAKYPDPAKDYEAYKNNLLEKEAWKNGDLSQKIYSYLKSIWSI